MDKPAPLDMEKITKAIKCYAETIYRFNGVWEGPDPLTPIVPLFLIQITIAILAVRLLMVALKPFNQPAFVAEILSGLILGPSLFGRFDTYRKFLFPNYNMRILEPMAQYALTLYAFLMGLQMDVRAIMRTGVKPVHVAIAGTIVPFAIGASMFFMLNETNKTGAYFWGAALTVTGFKVLAKILDKQKLLQTEIGKTALSAALINDMGSWFFLALGFVFTGSTSNIPWAILATTIFVVVCVNHIRPALGWIIRKTPEGQGYSEFYICSILAGVSLFGVFTDACGTHPMIGAFVFGLIIPSDALQAALMDRLEDFILGIFMPIFFVVSGLRTNVDVICTSKPSCTKAFSIIVLAFVPKLLGTIALSFLHEMPIPEAVAIGVLTSAKSTMALIILEVAQTQGALSTSAYSLMVVIIVVMTMVVTPVTLRYRPSETLIPYKRRTIQKAKSEEELRIITCIHSTSNVSTMINLLEASNSSHKSPIVVFALHLVELIGRTSAMLVVHNSRRAGPRNPSNVEVQTESILHSFDNYELRSEGVTTQVLTVRSNYTSMDEDICCIARDKRASFVILPFHRQQGLAGEIQELNPAIRNVNEGILANAPCSVGVLINRGPSEARKHGCNIAMLYFGGPDDREGLAYAWRMAEHPNNRLRVVRFIPSEQATRSQDLMEEMDFVEKSFVSVQVLNEREKMMDDEFINKFKISTMNDETITYTELLLNDEEETINAIKAMDAERYDLYIVGKGRGMASPLTAGLADWCDCPELGPIGDLLVTSEFESSFEVLVVQQYVKQTEHKEGSVRSASSLSQRADMHLRASSASGSDILESYPSFRRELEP